MDADERQPVSPDAEPALLVPVVVGGHLRAELGDRACAQKLARTLDACLSDLGSELRACVLTDLWHLNDERFRGRPAISVGGPELNAYTAFLAGKLPSVLSQEGVLVVQLDLEYIELVGACWGATHESTAAACEHFADRYLADFAGAVVRAHDAG